MKSRLVPAHIILGLTFTLFVASVAFSAGAAAEEISQDGSWWSGSIPEQSRVWVVEGMIDAYSAGYAAGNTAEGARIESEAGAYLPASYMQALHGVIYRKDSAGNYAAFDNEPTFPSTFGFYEAGISDYYETHPGAMSTPVGYVIGCLAQRPAMTCASVAAMPH